MVTDEFSVTYISFEKDAVRGNHYHKETVQTDVVLSGRLLLVHRFGKNNIVNRTVLVEGDSITHEAGEAHAYQATKPSEMVSICVGKRRGPHYEEDTYRLKDDEKLI